MDRGMVQLNTIQYYTPQPIFTPTQTFNIHIHQQQQTYVEKIKKLHKAAINNKEQEVYKLIADGVNVNAAAFKSLNTALHYACIYNHLNIVKILSYKDANPNLKNHMGNTPLHCASYLGYLEIGKILINKYANVNIVNNKNETPFHFAVLSFIEYKENKQLKCKPIEFIKLLLHNDADTTVRNNQGNTAFQIKNNQGNTALHIAAFNGDVEMAQIIINDEYHNINNINIQNNNGETPLYFATFSLTDSKKHESSKKEQLIQLIKLLLDKGARTTIKNHENFRPDNQITLIVADTPPNEQDAVSTKEERSFINRAHTLLLCAKLESLALTEAIFPLKQSII